MAGTRARGPRQRHLAGAPLPNAYAGDGEDGSDVLLGEPRARTRPILWEWRFRVHGYPVHHCPQLAIRQGDWKLLINPDGSRAQLYNIPKDPMELDNQGPNHPELVTRLSAGLLAWHKTLPKGPRAPQAGKLGYPWPGRTSPKNKRQPPANR